LLMVEITREKFMYVSHGVEGSPGEKPTPDGIGGKGAMVGPEFRCHACSADGRNTSLGVRRRIELAGTLSDSPGAPVGLEIGGGELIEKGGAARLIEYAGCYQGHSAIALPGDRVAGNVVTVDP